MGNKKKSNVDAGKNEKNQHKFTENMTLKLGGRQEVGDRSIQAKRDAKNNRAKIQIDSEDQGEINATRNTAGDSGRASRGN